MTSISIRLEQFTADTQLRLRTLYDRAETEAGLTATDFYSVDDLLELSGLRDVESLHVLLLAMFAALNEGSPCVEVSREALAIYLANLAGPEADRWAEQIVEDLDRARYTELVGQNVEENKPLVVHKSGKGRFVYFQKFLKHELVACELLQQRCSAGPTLPDEQQVKQVLAEVGRAGSLNADQRFALALALVQPLAIVSGGPGTGKTSIVGSLLRCLVRLGYAPGRIALAAPTGRAAQRMTDALHAGLARLSTTQNPADSLLQECELKASTLHQLLAYSPTSGLFRHHQQNPLAFDVVIVDEVSMVGLTLLAQLLRALPATARLVLLGDKDQLPSVEAGSWLAHLTPANGEPGYSERLLTRVKEILPGLTLPAPSSGEPADVLAVLKENFRSERRIQELAAAVNRQEVAALDRVPRLVPGKAVSSKEGQVSSLAEAEKQGGCWLMEPVEGGSWWPDVLQRWADHHYLAGNGAASFREQCVACVLPAHEELPPTSAELPKLFAVVEGARILTLVREGSWGAAGVNQRLARILRPPGEWGFLFPGAPVLLTRNDHARQLFNGDVGLTLPVEGGGLRVIFPRRGGFVSLAVDALPAHEYAYALTVHKSQGSEYGQILLVVPPQGGRQLLTKELVYTGLTRAKRVAILCGPVGAFQQAIQRKVRRTSGVMGSG